LLAKYFGGALSINDMSKMKWLDILFWYNIYILQATEESVVSELSTDDKGNKKTLPSYQKIREITLKKIEDTKNGG